MPKSDGEFYQFCYVTHAGDIRGASTPFQFRSATPTEELLTVTEDDSNSDILVVTTKTGLLEVGHTSLTLISNGGFDSKVLDPYQIHMCWSRPDHDL